MKIKIITLICFTLCFIAYSQDKSINFEKGSFEDALTKAKEENKLIFIDCYTTWCAPCKKMAKYVFTQEEVYSFFNENYINVKMDMEKGEGIELAQYYGVDAYPTLLVLDQEGEVLSKFVGASDADNLIESGKAALELKKS